MLNKRDVLYYRRLSYANLLLGAAIIGTCFISGISAKFHTAEIHVFAPYWVGIPLILQAMCTFAAARTAKRWPLAPWMIFFVLGMCAVTSYLITYPGYHTNLYERFPCFIQTNYKTDKTRCICAMDYDNVLRVDGVSTTQPCIRALNILLIMGNINYMITCLSLIPVLLTFVLVCNDLCCLSCRRSASIPQVIVAQTQPGAPAQYVQIQQQTVTYRTDEQQPGTSVAAPQSDQAGPLPQKPKNPGGPPEAIPHSF